MYLIVILFSVIIILLIYITFNITNSNSKKVLEKEYATGKKSGRDTIHYPYEKKMLLTKAEYAFYNILKSKCDKNNMLICPKVRMEDFLNVTDKKNTLKYRGYIRSRHIDFMLCDNKLRLLGGIELDDNSHQDKNAKEIDEFKNKVFETIKLPLFRVRVSQGMYEKQIDDIINSLNNGSIHNQ